MSRTKPTVCFHGHCYETRFYSVTPAFLAATHYTFTPSVGEEQRRAEHIQRALARNLQWAVVWPQKLPRELWLMVAGLLVQDCATITAQEQVQASNTVDDSVLDLTQSVYASYVKIDGRYYVKSLQNKAGASGGKGTCLVLPARTARQESKDMFVAEDHLGIRRVVFISPKRRDEWCRNHPSVLGAWWRHISHKAVPSTVAIKGDVREQSMFAISKLIQAQGLKMRNVESAQMEPLALIRWQAPVPSPPAVVDLLTLERPREYPNGLRMRFFDCNAANIVGYFVATDGARVLAILSHKQDEKVDTSLYEDVSTAICFWMYMPINEGEYLTEICRRAGCLIIRNEVVGITVGRIPFPSQPRLTDLSQFSTNQGRTVVFGLYGHENVDCRRVTTLPRGPCRLYFNQLDSLVDRCEVELVAFEQTGPVSQDNLPTPPVSISDCPYTQSNEVWLYSSCSMRHLTEVYPCIKMTTPYRPLIGMLLSYSDGHRECVGQFRLDWVVERILVGETDKLYICGRRTKERWGYIAAVTCRAPANRTEDRWLEVAKTGTLEWWFSSRHSVLFHDNTRLN